MHQPGLEADVADAPDGQAPLELDVSVELECDEQQGHEQHGAVGDLQFLPQAIPIPGSLHLVNSLLK